MLIGTGQEILLYVNLSCVFMEIFELLLINEF